MRYASFMQFKPIRTELFQMGFDIAQLKQYIGTIKRNSVICISNKIISLSENRVYANYDKDALAQEMCNQYLGKSAHSHVTVIQNILMLNAGIDASNANGCLIAWPLDCFNSAKKIWHMLRQDHDQFAVILVDTRTSIMRKGCIGICTGCYGLAPLRSYIGTLDLYNRPLTGTKINIADSIAATACMLMGEANEQTPIVLVTEAEIEYCPTTQAMIDELIVKLEEDMYLSAPGIRR